MFLNAFPFHLQSRSYENLAFTFIIGPIGFIIKKKKKTNFKTHLPTSSKMYYLYSFRFHMNFNKYLYQF